MDTQYVMYMYNRNKKTVILPPHSRSIGMEVTSNNYATWGETYGMHIIIVLFILEYYMKIKDINLI